ncbi:PAS domain-containing protein [Mycolicibacillus koreensis]|uniref:PAS domain-containing protein n=1 Tax=Mycolicibacillus koreensis TaxID=1069220 RepID=UPI00138DB149|nr:PAS domain-containing protein [Mycolicibacillus koreensis]BBY56222.1 hypothetical protein MKOR_34730 [Mycolicibacillus koreensis]
MGHDWLLVETLGEEPTVVAEGATLKDLVPLAIFLRRSPYRAAVQTAITETVQNGESLASITPKHARVIRTEPVKMPDGRVHGVHVWLGPASAEPPERQRPGALKWDLTSHTAIDTAESLVNAGKDLHAEGIHERAFTDDLPARELTHNEAQVVALAIKAEPGHALCSSWDVTDWQDNPIRVSFVARIFLEPTADGVDHLVARGMNWRGQLDEEILAPEQLAQRVLDALAQPGVHRALVDLDTWTLLRWLDEPCPFDDWRSGELGEQRVHPDDTPLMESMRTEFEHGPTSRVLRLRRADDDWVPLHVTVNRVELEDNEPMGLVALRLPSDAELADAGLH